MRSTLAPCGDTPLLRKERRVLSALWIPQGPAPGLERPGKKDHAPPPATVTTSHSCSGSQALIPYSHHCPRRGCSPTEDPEAELGGLERRSWLRAFNSPPVLSLALGAKLSHCVTIPFQPRKLRLRWVPAWLEFRPCLSRCTGRWLGRKGIWGRSGLRSPACVFLSSLKK